MSSPAPPARTPATTARLARDLSPLRPGTLEVLMDVTNQCNLRCRMCYFSYPEVFGRPAEQMSPETFARVAAETFPYARQVVLSAGSEPLVHDDFPGLLALAAPYRVPRLKFLTNAQLLDERVARAAITCGVTEIHVSADGATRETYEWVRRGASFDRLVENLERLAELKRALGSDTPRVQFNVTLMRCNVDELPAFARLARRLGVQQLACRHLLPYEGLDIEDQCLVHDRRGANAALQRGLDAAAAEGVDVVMFPDPFGEEDRDGAPWTELDRTDRVARHVGFEVRHATSFAGESRVRTGRSTTPASGDAAPATEASPAPAGTASPASTIAAPAASAPRTTQAPAAPASRAPSPAASPSPATSPTPAASRAPSTAPRTASRPARHPSVDEPLPRRLSWWPARLPWAPGPPDDAEAHPPEHPFGLVEAPHEGSPRRGGALVLSGWALHRAGVARVLICRRGAPLPASSDAPAGDPCRDWPGALRPPRLVPLVEARFVVGARPDVAARFPQLPDTARAGWRARLHPQDLPGDAGDGSRHDLIVVAEGRDGRRAAIGRRLLHVDTAAVDRGQLYCAQPFQAVYLDAGTNVYPYPDCQTVEPFGRLLDGPSFAELWRSEAFEGLRRRIVDLDPPAMCRGCPEFVNRNPDDPDYYVPRQLTQTFRLPHGQVESPPLGAVLPAAGLTLAGWAAGASPVVRVEVLREALASDPPDRRDEDGLVSWTDAWLGDARDDVAGSRPRLEGGARAGWSASLLGTGLPPDLERLVLRVRAHSAEGGRVQLGRLVLERSAVDHWTVSALG